MKKTLIAALTCLSFATLASALDIDLNLDNDTPRTYAIQEERVVDADALSFPLSGYRLAEPGTPAYRARNIVAYSEPLQVLPETNTQRYLRKMNERAPNHR